MWSSRVPTRGGMPALDTLHRELGLYALRQRIDQALAAAAEASGVSTAQLMILIAIVASEDRSDAGVTFVSETLGISGPFATNEVNVLVERKFAVKRPNAQDKRRIQLMTTAAGRQLLASIDFQVFGHLIRSLPDLAPR